MVRKQAFARAPPQRVFQPNLSRNTCPYLYDGAYISSILTFFSQKFQQIDFCLREWSTGTFVQATFFEKDVIHTHKIYRAEVETWSNINLTVTSNIRKKLFTRALYVHRSISYPRF